MSELLPCPFCGGQNVGTTYKDTFSGDFRRGVYCADCCGGIYPYYDTEAEAIAAWNNRTPIEYDGWFYLPKPKEGIVVYGEPEIIRTENGYKVRQIADIVDEAARRWGEELGEYAMQRICEIWNSRAERTCKMQPSPFTDWAGLNMRIVAGWYCENCGECCLTETTIDDDHPTPNYCPNCGCKVVGE